LIPDFDDVPEDAPADKPTPKPRRKIPFPDFTDWSPESLAKMEVYIKYLAKNYSNKSMVNFVRRIVRNVVIKGDKKFRPVQDFDKSLLKYKARLETGTYTDSKGRVHTFDTRLLQSLNGKWLSHYKIQSQHTFEWIKKNIRSPDIYQQIPAEVLMLIQVLHSKRINIKGVVPHGTHTIVVNGVANQVAKCDLASDEPLRVYVGPSVPFEKCFVIGPDYAYDPRKDGVKLRVEDYKSGFQRYLSLLPTVDQFSVKADAASGAGEDDT